MITSIIRFVFIFYIVPYFVGLLFTKDCLDDKINGIEYIIYYYVIGLLTMLSVFELLCVPLSILKIDLHVLLLSYSICVVFLLIASVILIIKKKIKLIPCANKIMLSKFEMVILILVIIFVGVQLFFVIYYQSNWMSGDDWDYVTRTSASLYTDKIVTMGADAGLMSIIPKRSFCSWEIFIAWLCKLTGIDVPVMVHTVLNVSLVFIAFEIMYLLGYKLFDKYEERFIFLAIVSFSNMFGLYSHYSLTFRWLMTIWQGKAVFMTLVFQFIFVYALDIVNKDYNIRYQVIIIIISIASCALTPTGVGMFVGAIFVITILLCFTERKMYYIKYFFASIIFPSIYMLGFLIMR